MYKFSWRNVKKKSKLDLTDFYYSAEQIFVSRDLFFLKIQPVVEAPDVQSKIFSGSYL